MTQLILRRILAAPRAAVWREWTDPAELSSWFWPTEYHAFCSITAEPGGHWRLASRPKDLGAEGEFLIVEHERRLVFTWQWDRDHHQTITTVSLTDEPDGGTAMLVAQGDFSSDAEMDQQERVWRGSLERLGARQSVRTGG